MFPRSTFSEKVAKRTDSKQRRSNRSRRRKLNIQKACVCTSVQGGAASDLKALPTRAPLASRAN